MSTYVTVADVAERYEQALPIEQEAYVSALIDEAETILAARVPNLAARITAETITLANVVVVIRRVVLRVLRNPQGYMSESDGTYSYRIDTLVASGLLDFTAADLALVTGTISRPRIGTIGIRPASPWQIPDDVA